MPSRYASSYRVVLGIALAVSLLLGAALTRVGAGIAIVAAALPLTAALLVPGRHRALLTGVLLALMIPSWWGIGVQQANGYRIASLLALFTVINGPGRMRLGPTDALLIAFLGDALVSGLIQTAEPGVGAIILYILLPVGFYLAARALPERLHRRVVVTAVAAIAIGALTVIVERFAGHVLFRDAQSYSWVVGNGGVFRPGGIYGSPPAASLALVIGLLLTASLLSAATRRQRLILSLAVPVMLLALVLTFERTGMLALAAGALVFMLLRGLKAGAVLKYGVLAGLVTVAAILTYPQVESTATFQNGVLRQGTLAARTSIWQEELPVVTSSPRTEAIGVGFGSTILARQGGIVPEALALHPRLISSSIHNQYLLILLEQGGLGLVMFVLFLAATIWSGVRFTTLTRDPLAAGMTACIVALCVASITTTPILDRSSWILSLLVLGLLVARASQPFRVRQARPALVAPVAWSPLVNE